METESAVAVVAVCDVKNAHAINPDFYLITLDCYLHLIVLVLDVGHIVDCQ